MRKRHGGCGMNKERVFVYRNLRFKGVMYSVKSLKTHRVILRTPVVYLTDVELKVSEAGRKRVLKEKQKNVHAGVVGYMEPIGVDAFNCNIRVTYDPYKQDSFTRVHDGSKVKKAKSAYLERNVWIYE
jgi:hypothetical protein